MALSQQTPTLSFHFQFSIHPFRPQGSRHAVPLHGPYMLLFCLFSLAPGSTLNHKYVETSGRYSPLPSDRTHACQIYTFVSDPARISMRIKSSRCLLSVCQLHYVSESKFAIIHSWVHCELIHCALYLLLCMNYITCSKYLVTDARFLMCQVYVTFT